MDSKLQIIINDGDIKLICSRKLDLCSTQTSLLFSRVFGTPTDQARDKHFPRWRCDKNKASVRKRFTNLTHTSNIDFKQERHPASNCIINWTTRCPVMIFPVNECPLQHLFGINELGELVLTDKVVVHPVDFSRSRRTCCHRNREFNFRK